MGVSHVSGTVLGTVHPKMREEGRVSGSAQSVAETQHYKQCHPRGTYRVFEKEGSGKETTGRI